jgi:hypothetical protein
MERFTDAPLFNVRGQGHRRNLCDQSFAPDAEDGTGTLGVDSSVLFADSFSPACKHGDRLQGCQVDDRLLDTDRSKDRLA